MVTPAVLPPVRYCTGIVAAGVVAPPIWSEMGTALPVCALWGTNTLI